jgi:hypothetical protein
MTMRLPISPRLLLGIALPLWGGGLAAGALALWKYSATPGTVGAVSQVWPETAPISRQDGRPVLIMLAHPQCPCTQASVDELAELLKHGGADAWVLFLCPEGKADWEHTDLWNSAAAIPGVRVMADADGRAARAFGAETSGHVFFYDGVGHLQFSGGITASRGHRGPSAGAESILAALRGGQLPANEAATFGCPLNSPEAPR